MARYGQLYHCKQAGHLRSWVILRRKALHLRLHAVPLPLCDSTLYSANESSGTVEQRGRGIQVVRARCHDAHVPSSRVSF